MFFCFVSCAFSQEDDTNSALRILNDPLRATQDREHALNQLVSARYSELPSVLLSLFKNAKEPIVLRRSVGNAMTQLNSIEIRMELNNLVFHGSGADSFAREEGLALLVKISNDKEKEKLFSDFVYLAQESNEPGELRKAAIGYASNAKFVPEKNEDWAKKIVSNKREATQVRTSALNYMEVNQAQELDPLLPQIILDATENSDFRQIAILKGARMPSNAFSLTLQSIIANKKEELKIRKLSLSALLGYAPHENPLPFLKQVLATENDLIMRRELEEAVGQLEQPEK